MHSGGAPLAPCQLEYLPWDTDHFGLRVGRLCVPSLEESVVVPGLAQAREQAYELVYLIGPAGAVLSPEVAEQYGAHFVDRKLTYRAVLGEIAQQPLTAAKLEQYPQGPACADLLTLALAAGKFSRFFIDRRISRYHAEQLFAAWVDKSARRLLADCVIVARIPETPDRIVGMVTMTVVDGLGKIGLLAVAETARGQGVGTALVVAANSWMRDHNAKAAEVVTQAANPGANRLYRRCGYRISDVRDVYHCWLTI